ncbi:hypothetical protein [Magnetospirillum sp. 64-120]|uniref:hypothetical protein n=1 Tax=Magnetospirillum sp. 64-120 TaxID=1895778 RepID=UPI0009273416|nr:hypothetical protein [Magnetospirillum sp. 64-120]OJX78564.1 MAG: hypothetical protein BGO92_01560 [Magnetospirillum sp. 64-120]
MSRYSLEPRDIADRHLEIVIGWDPPLHTYFVQVLDPTCDEEDSGFEILWCGVTPGEIPSADEAILLIAPWAVIPAGLRATLIADRAAKP